MPPAGPLPLPAWKDYFFLASRKSGDSARVKRTTSSPVTVLMSWCRLSTLTPVTSWTIASRTGRAVSIRWVRTCLSKSRPFLGRKRLDQLLFGRGQNPLEADDEEITEQVGVNVLGTPAHIVLLKATNSFANSSFEFSQCSHSKPPCYQGIPKRKLSFYGQNGNGGKRSSAELRMARSRFLTMTSCPDGL